MISVETSGGMTELTGDHHADKLVYREIIEKIFREKLSEISADKLRIIERYIAEIVLLSQGKLSKVLRFAVAYPFLDGSGTIFSG
jgi:hypothetical protein